MKTTLKLYNKSNPSSSEKRPDKSYNLQNFWLITGRETTACLYKRAFTDPNEKRAVKRVYPGGRSVTVLSGVHSSSWRTCQR